MKQEQEYLYSRQFLNEDLEQLGAIGCFVKRASNEVWATLHIGDCNRTLHIDFNCLNDTLPGTNLDVTFQQSLGKINRIRDELNALEAAIKTAYKDAKQYKKRKRK